MYPKQDSQMNGYTKGEEEEVVAVVVEREEGMVGVGDIEEEVDEPPIWIRDDQRNLYN